MTETDKLITIGIVNYNSSDFILNSLYCLERITKNDYQVIIRDNNSVLQDYLNLKNNLTKYKNVSLYRVENFNYKGSMAHGIAINDLIKRIDTKYGVIMDADFTFLYENWDEILINELDEKFAVIGTQASTTSKKYIDFPLLIGGLFYARILKEMNFDFLPINPKEFKDVGYGLKMAYLERGYDGKIIHFKSTRSFKLGPFNKLICAEFYLDGHDKIFASHFGRGSSLGKAKYLRGWKKKIYKKPIIGKPLLRLKGKREKKKWIKICRKIVDNLH